MLAHLIVVGFASLFALLSHGAPKVVEVAREPAQKMVYGMDFERLWSWDTLRPAEKKRLARLAVGECRVQYARVAVRAAIFRP